MEIDHMTQDGDGSSGTPPNDADQAMEESGHRFPHGATLGVGVWLLFSSVFFVVALLLTLRNEGVPVPEGVYFLAVTIWAGAIGATITTILGYLDHACEKGDFKTSYVPWYVGRPVMGSLLAIVVYCLLETPFLSLKAGGDQSIWNEWQLAGLAGLVGLFSRPAIEKLEEVFKVVFATRDDEDRNEGKDGDATNDQSSPDSQTPDSPTADSQDPSSSQKSPAGAQDDQGDVVSGDKD